MKHSKWLLALLFVLVLALCLAPLGASAAGTKSVQLTDANGQTIGTITYRESSLSGLNKPVKVNYYVNYVYQGTTSTFRPWISVPNNFSVRAASGYYYGVAAKNSDVPYDMTLVGDELTWGIVALANGTMTIDLYFFTFNNGKNLDITRYIDGNTLSTHLNDACPSVDVKYTQGGKTYQYTYSKFDQAHTMYVPRATNIYISPNIRDPYAFDYWLTADTMAAGANRLYDVNDDGSLYEHITYSLIFHLDLWEGAISTTQTTAMYYDTADYDRLEVGLFMVTNPYVVTYDKNAADATGTTRRSTFRTYGTFIRNNGFSRPGYTFTGWNTQPDGSGTAYQPGDYYTTKQNMTLYAQWRSNTPEEKYTVQYAWTGAPAGQSLPLDYTEYPSVAAAQAAVDTTYPANDVVTGTDGYLYTFSGWDAGTVSGTVVTFRGAWTQTPDLSQTKALHYTVEYYKDGSRVDEDTDTVTEDVWVNSTQLTLTVLKSEINTTDKYEGYALDRTDPAEIPDVIGNGGVIKVYYGVDENDDNIPDKYQKKVTFKIENGVWSDTTDADRTVYVTLTDDEGNWSVTGSGSLAAPSGMTANTGYKQDSGKWDVTPPATVSGTTPAVYTYSFDLASTPIIPSDMVLYVTQHFKAGEDGSYPAAPTDTDVAQGVIGETVTGVARTYEGYCLNPQAPGTKRTGTLATITSESDIVILKLYYDVDQHGDPADPENKGDGVPDKYQKKVTFAVENGAWADGTTADRTVYVTLTDAEDKWSEAGSGPLTAPSGMTASVGYKQESGAWDTEPPTTVSGTEPAVYTYHFDLASTPIVPGDKVLYITAHFKAGEDGNYPETPTDTVLSQGTIGETVSAVAKEYEGYCLNPQAPGTKTGGMLVTITDESDIVVLKLYYDADRHGDPADPENKGDGIPDKYQKKVTFQVENGTWADGTSEEQIVYLTLKDEEDNWSATGTAALTAPSGMTANTGYKQESGAWDTTPPATVSGTTPAVYTYHFDLASTPIVPGDKVLYITEHYVANEDGSYPEAPTDTVLTQGTVGETVSAVEKEYEGYCLNPLAEGTKRTGTLATITADSDIVVLKLYYDADRHGDPADPENKGDGIPDKYQKKVTFAVENGSWADDSTAEQIVYLTLKDETDNWSATGTAALTAPTGMKALEGYKQESGAWDTTPPATVSGTAPAVYTYSFDLASTPIVPSDKVLYITEHYVANEDGSYPETPTDTVLAQGTIGETVSAVEKEYEGYCLNLLAEGTKASGLLVRITAEDKIVVLKLYYDADRHGDPADPENKGDDIPDKYQKKVVFRVENGAWADDSTAEQIVYLTLKDDEDNWSATGTAALTAPTGMKALEGYKQESGAWDTVPPTTVSGTAPAVYTYHFDLASTPIVPSDKVLYITEHYVANEDGSYPETPTDTVLAQGTIGETVSAVEKEYEGYCLNPLAEGTKRTGLLVKITAEDKIVVLKLYYDADRHGDPADPENKGDDIPDKYQKKVTFQVENGTWADDSTAAQIVYLTLKDAEDNWSESGTAALTAPSGMKANTGYKQESGAWDVTPPATVSGTAPAIYTYHFDLASTPIVPSDKVLYITEHYKADEDGSYPALPTDAVLSQETIGETVNAVPKEFEGYCLNPQAPGTKDSGVLVKITSSDDIVVLKLYYDADRHGDPADPENKGDGIPDKFQKKVTYRVENGLWADDTAADQIVYRTLKDEAGNWSATGTAVLYTPTGMKALEGYKQESGAWDTEPPATASGTEPAVYTYHFDLAGIPIVPSDKVLYLTEHFKADEVGVYPETPTDTDAAQGTIGETVTAVPKEYEGYCLNPQAPGTKDSGVLVKITTDEDIVVLKLYYDADRYGDPADPEHKGDGVPDKFQKKVTFRVENGVWADNTFAEQIVYLTLKDAADQYSATGTATLTAPTGMKALEGYKQEDGAWDVTPPATVSGTEPEIYTYVFPMIIAPPDPHGDVDPAATGAVKLEKVDAADSSTKLAGVSFSLYDTKGKLIGTYKTGADGVITVKGLPLGSYYWVEISAAEGYVLDTTASKFTVSGGKTASLTVTNTKSSVPGAFTNDHYAYIIGYDDGMVHPEAGITRAEVATVFFRLLSDEVRDRYLTKENSFKDVPREKWFNTAVSTMAAMGVIKGKPDGTYGPNDQITRAEFAAIAARFDANGNTSGASFSDIYTHWAAKEIAVAANNGWVLGYEDGTFKPDQTITRAEAVTMVNRVLQRIPESQNDLLKNMVKWPDNTDVTKWYYLAVQEAGNSHYYVRKDNGYESWIALRPVRDWRALER